MPFQGENAHRKFFSVILGLNLRYHQSASLKLYAAGSLKEALSDVAAAYEKTYQTKVTTKFGPSGLLRKGIEEGESPDIFASEIRVEP